MLRLIKLSFIISLLIILMFPVTANALSGADWRAGNIISDSTFYNNGDMSAVAIQNFLNSKLSSCDTWGTKSYSGNQTRAQYATSRGYPPPYTCLKDYSQNGKSSAQIIKEASDAHQISPRILLVLLQKEQSLVTDDWPWSVQYRSATGYGCPDTAPCDAQYYGFTNQVNKAAWQFRRYATNPGSYRYKPFQSNYIQYNPNTACGGTNVYVENYATAGLYNYTPYQPNPSALANLYGIGDSCGAYGNRNFWRLFSDWFGNPQQSNYECDSKHSSVKCVWSLTNSAGGQLLTVSSTERDNAINKYHWRYEGIALYASSTQKTATIPVYRLQGGGRYYFTANTAERNALLNSPGWTDEGIGFFAYPSTTSANASKTVDKLYNTSSGQYYWTADSARMQLLQQNGYTTQTPNFRGLSKIGNITPASSSRNNIYELRNLTNGFLYTTSLSEAENAVSMGFSFVDTLTSSPISNIGSPVYRLRGARGWLFTTNPNERNYAISRYGYSDEGIGFYMDGFSGRIYRLTNVDSSTFKYTGSIGNLMNIVNTSGWKYDGTLYNLNTPLLPVFRFLSAYNGRHFYTIDINEATNISNKGWDYEAVAFYASTSQGQPVYRLRFSNKYLYTVSENEKNNAISKYKYSYEGVVYYVSISPTDTPVYRLQGGNDEYFYTSSVIERDSAIRHYRYRSEGVGFYLPTGN
ncbi:MAG: hypothetical protein U0413_02780 [Candidatus Saccharimonadales bacterium]